MRYLLAVSGTFTSLFHLKEPDTTKPDSLTAVYTYTYPRCCMSDSFTYSTPSLIHLLQCMCAEQQYVSTLVVSVVNYSWNILGTLSLNTLLLATISGMTQTTNSFPSTTELWQGLGKICFKLIHNLKWIVKQANEFHPEINTKPFHLFFFPHMN